MSVPRDGIGYETFSLAMNAPAQLLEPGAEAQALQWVAAQSSGWQSFNLGGAMIYAMSHGERRAMASDFNRPTPERHVAPYEHHLTRFGLVQLALAARFGVPFGIPSQHEGALVQNILPFEEPAPTTHDPKSGSQFGFHTEQAANPDPAERPDVVLFGCVRNVEGAAISIARMGHVYCKMHPLMQEYLQRPDFKFHDAFHPDGPDLERSPVLERRPNGGFTIRLGVDTKPLSNKALHALRHLKKLLLDVAEPITLRHGEILALPRSILHWDKEYTPAPDPKDRRWLQRTYIRYPQRFQPFKV